MTERPNNLSALDRDDLIELIEDAMDRVHDMDVTFRQYAESAADAVLATRTVQPEAMMASDLRPVEEVARELEQHLLQPLRQEERRAFIAAAIHEARREMREADAATIRELAEALREVRNIAQAYGRETSNGWCLDWPTTKRIDALLSRLNLGDER